MSAPKCRVCGKKVDKVTAFKIVNDSGRNEYYCTEEEYRKKKNEQMLREDTYRKIYDIFGETISDTRFYKEMTNLLAFYTMKEINDIVTENFEELIMIMTNKNFDTKFGKIRYFFKVIATKLEKAKRLNQPVQSNYIPKEVQVDMPDMKYKPRKQRVSLEDITMEVGEDDYE